MRLTRDTRDLATAAIGVVTLVAVAFGHRPPGTQEGTPEHPAVRLAYFPNLTHAPALVGVARGTFAQALDGYTLTTRVVNAGPEAMEALLAGEVDLAYVGPSPALNTYLKTNGKALRILAGACSGGASLIARGDENIRSLGDLGGKRVAVPQFGGTQDVSCRHFLASVGLRPTSERGTVELLSVKNPDILTAFKQRQIDAAWVPEPWAARLQADTGAKTVVDERDLWPNRQFTTTVVVVRSAFAETHPDLVAKFLAAHRQTVAWLQKNPAEGQEVVNAELKRLVGKPLKPGIIREAWTRLAFTDDANPANVVAFAEAARDAGYLKGESVSLDRLFADTRVAQKPGSAPVVRRSRG